MSYTEWDFPHTHFYDTDLRELIAKCGSYDEVINELNKWIKENTPKIDEILNFMKQLEEGYIPPALKEAIYDWATNNLLPIIAKTIKSVVLGLTDDVHFIAIFSDSLSDIVFNTTELDIWLPIQPEFGHLTLSIKGE